MMARKKPLSVVPAAQGGAETQFVRFEKPAPKGGVKLVDEGELDTLIDLLHNEAKVI